MLEYLRCITMRIDQLLRQLQDALEQMNNQNRDRDDDQQNPFDSLIDGSAFENISDLENMDQKNLFDGPLEQFDFGGYQDLTSQQDDSGPQGVHTEGDDVVVVVDLPGYTEEQITLTADNYQLRVDAEATEDMRRDSVSKVYQLDNEVVSEEASAELENGVLTVRLPMRNPSEDETQIDIE